MSQDQKFQQQWEFGRRDDDIDSSSNDFKSFSDGEPVLKKHKLVSNLIMSGIDEPSNTPSSQEKGQLEPGMGVHFVFGKANGKQTGLRKKVNAKNHRPKRSSVKDCNKKKSKCSTQEPVSLDDFKIFTESILDELKVARENMFVRMREEMQKLVPAESASRPTRRKSSCVQKTSQAQQHQNNAESGMRTQNHNGGSLQKSVISSRIAGSNDGFKVLEERVGHDQAIETITSDEKDKGERLRLSVNKPMHSSSHSDQIVTSSYLTLPSVLSEPRTEQNRVDSSSRNCIQPGAAGNDANLNFERANLMVDASTHRGYFSRIQADEPFGSFAQMGSKGLGCYDQNSTQNSSMGTGLPIPLHQRLENSFNIPSQVVLENSLRGNNVMGLRMNGGAIRFSGGSHTLSEQFANNFRGHINYKTDGVRTYGTQDLRDGHLHPK